MDKHLLSKSSFLRAQQCMKSLYLYRYHYRLRDEVSQEQMAIFNRGTSVGLLARQLFPGGVDASPPSVSKYRESVLKTQELIGQGATVIYEAAFQFEQVLCAVDILVKENNRWKAYEVKSSTKITQVYISDASLQYYVMKNSGLELEEMNMVTINNQYVKKGKINISELFMITPVMEEALKYQASVEEKIKEAKQVLVGKRIPEIPIGEHCSLPYRCDFMGYCWKDIPENSILDIPGITRGELFRLFNSGVKKISDLPGDYAPGKTAETHLKSLRENKILADKTGLKQFVDELTYPLLFVDFESFMPAVPLFNGTRPYQHIPFQYSIHRKESRDSEIKHLEFISETGIDPRKGFIEKFLDDTRGANTLLVYNATFEKSILKSLKADFPEVGKRIDECIEKIKDLMKPFSEKLIYHPAMKGSSSIKSVLPALVPDLHYDGLKISNGAMAMIAFEQLQSETDLFKIAETRDALLEYCKLDTLAMVKILEVIEKILESGNK